MGCVVLDLVDHLVKHIKSLALVFHNRVLLGVNLEADAPTQLMHGVDMVHPVAVYHLEQDHPLQLPHDLRPQLRFLCLVKSHRLLLQGFGQLVRGQLLQLLSGIGKLAGLKENFLPALSDLLRLPAVQIIVFPCDAGHRAPDGIADHGLNGAL